MATLNAGNSGASIRGYAASGNVLGVGAFGTWVDGIEPFPGYVIDYFYTFGNPATSASIAIRANVPSTFFGGSFPGTIYVDGVAWTVTSYSVYNGTITSFGISSPPATFVSGTNYEVALSLVPADPNITTPTTGKVLRGKPLALAITADKSIASAAITGGTNAADFSLSGTTLDWVGGTQDVEGSYSVEITITDTDGLTDTVTLTREVVAVLVVAMGVQKRAGATSTTTYNFSNLTLVDLPALTLEENDLVLIFQSVGSTLDRTLSISTTGYTKEGDLNLYSNGTSYDSNMALFTKFMGPSPDSSVTIGSTGSTASAQTSGIIILRGIDPTTYFDVALVTDQGTGTGKPNPPAITPTSPGSIIVCCGAQAAATMAALTSSSFDQFMQDFQADTQDCGSGIGYKRWTSGTFDPPAYGGGSSNAANAWTAMSVALRPIPLTTPEYVYKGANWAGRFVGAASEAALYIGAKTLHS